MKASDRACKNVRSHINEWSNTWSKSSPSPNWISCLFHSSRHSGFSRLSCEPIPRSPPARHTDRLLDGMAVHRPWICEYDKLCIFDAVLPPCVTCLVTLAGNESGLFPTYFHSLTISLPAVVLKDSVTCYDRHRAHPMQSGTGPVVWQGSPR